MRTGRVQIACKGKRRVALLPKALCRKLQRYAQAKRRYSGPLFVTAGGAPLDRSHIWSAMKALCRRARVAPEKVFPTTCATCSPVPTMIPPGSAAAGRSFGAQQHRNHPHLYPVGWKKSFARSSGCVWCSRKQREFVEMCHIITVMWL